MNSKSGYDTWSILPRLKNQKIEKLKELAEAFEKLKRQNQALMRQDVTLLKLKIYTISEKFNSK